MLEDLKNKYSATHKENLMRALSTPQADQTGVRDALAVELQMMAEGSAYPDFLELLPASNLVETLKLIQELISSGAIQPGSEDPDLSAIRQYRESLFQRFLKVFSDLSDNPSGGSDLPVFIQTNRKYLGMADTLSSLSNLAQIFSYIESRGLITEDGLSLICYGGSFNPFPHNGHIEVSQMALHKFNHSSPSKRIVINTASTDSNKPYLAQSFPHRLDNLYRGFIDEQYATVIGIAGDAQDKTRRIEQLELLAAFDQEQKLRLVMGSDILIPRVEMALAGDPYSLFFIREDHEVYLSPRKGDDKDAIMKAIVVARQQFNSNLVLMDDPVWGISGTLTRKQTIEQRRKYAPNAYVDVNDP
jgi:hypothetical protein